ncbi:MAG: hypothetical protein L0Y54_15585 [Sporichthyaceae bacterium]|nr:hypothetical protein [Sporichthyaceae bacterium]
MSSVRDDQLIYEYLSRVADAAHGKLPSLARQELVEKVRHEIEERRGSAGRTDVSKVLQSMGDPRHLVAKAAQAGGSEYAGYRPPVGGSGPEPPAVDSTQSLVTVAPAQAAAPAAPAPADPETTAVMASAGAPTAGPYASPAQQIRAASVGPVAASAEQIERRVVTAASPMSWLRARRAEPPAQVWRDAAAVQDYGRAVTTFQPVSFVRDYGVEVAALFALTVGALWISYLGWIVGLILTLASRNWSVRDKGIVVALIPAATLGAGIFYVWLTVGRDRPANISVSERFDDVSGYLVGVLKAWPIMAALLGATWLMSQLLARWAGAQRERWR